MDKLPQELIAHIVSYLWTNKGQPKETSSKPSQYAVISRKWQLAIEPLLYRTIRLQSPDLPSFDRLLVQHRRELLSRLDFSIVLPTYADHECAKFETREDQDRNSQVFTYAIHSLFQTLRQWNTGSAGMRLVISSIYSPMDRIHRPPNKLEQDLEDFEYGRRQDLWEHRYERSRLGLLLHPELPAVACVSTFELAFHPERLVEPESVVRIASKLSNVQAIILELQDNEKKDPSARQKSRYSTSTPETDSHKTRLTILLDFSAEMLKITNLPLRDLILNFYYEDPSNQYFTPPSALPPSDPSTDHLSLALSSLSQSSTLTSLTLSSIVISPSLYWPSDPSAKTPSWPSLRHFAVEFNMTSPTGDWYFIRDPSIPIDEDEDANDTDEEEDVESSDSDSDPDSPALDDPPRPDTYNEKREKRLIGDYPIRTFRTLPSSDLMNPLLLAMAHSAGQMPSLQTMSLTSTIRDPDAAGFEVYFHAKGERSKFDPDEEPDIVDKERLYWFVGSWRPDEEVLKTWKEGREKELVVRFVEW
ncbi:MAG: hypothetical protein Q9220_005637 [cf. Caloplaca sp. 1 TL-2023]